MSRSLTFGAAVAALAFAGWTVANAPTARSLRADGAPQQIGNGTVRTYVLFDSANREVPIEVGIAISESGMEGLPAPSMAHHADAMSSHFDTHERLLELPAQNPTPYKFVQFNWNPGGHEPPGIYDRPHFDFHFWTVPVAIRNSIVPGTPQFAEKAARYPAPEYYTEFYVDAATAAKATPAAVAVPQMGVHWLDTRSGEFNGQGFTKTYIRGTWDGRFVFDEPMITGAYIAAKRAATDPAVRDEVIPLPQTQGRQVAGFYPEAYRITYDAEAREYRIALTHLTWQQ